MLIIILFPCIHNGSPRLEEHSRINDLKTSDRGLCVFIINSVASVIDLPHEAA